MGRGSEDVLGPCPCHLLGKAPAPAAAGRKAEVEQKDEDAEVAILTGQVRRMLSIEGVRSQARCLIERLRFLGAGTVSGPISESVSQPVMFLDFLGGVLQGTLGGFLMYL